MIIKTLQNQKDYFIERDLFRSIFKKVDDMLWDKSWEFSNSEFKCFKESDTMYILHLDSGVIISYYKHLGRCNTCNINISINQIKWLASELENNLKCS